MLLCVSIVCSFSLLSTRTLYRCTTVLLFNHLRLVSEQGSILFHCTGIPWDSSPSTDVHWAPTVCWALSHTHSKEVPSQLRCRNKQALKRCSIHPIVRSCLNSLLKPEFVLWVKKGRLKDFFPHYLPYILLLLFFKSQLNEDLLQLFITVIDNELLKAVVL